MVSSTDFSSIKVIVKEKSMKKTKTASVNNLASRLAKMPVHVMSREELGRRILAEGVRVSNDTWKTFLNNNDLIVGTSGAGKTTGYVQPNLIKANHSLVVVDTKGQLYRNNADFMRRKGFRIECIDFVHPENTPTHYNPFDYIRWYKAKKKIKTELGELTEEVEKYREDDLMSIARLLIPDKVDSDDLFWPDAARNVIVSLMAYVLERLPREEQHMGSVCRLYDEMAGQAGMVRTNGNAGGGVSFFEDLEAIEPESFAVRMYRKYNACFVADKCWASIAQFVANALAPFEYSGNANLFNRPSSLLFPEIGRQKTILFVNISDTDRAMDNMVNIFYTQLFMSLCAEADSNHNGRLAVPVRIILDDFASNVCIPDFDKIISNIRSREIYATVILQSITQLDGMYKPGQAQTIINNCDHMLYLGGSDPNTAQFFAVKARKTPETILEMPLDAALYFERGSRARQVVKVKPGDEKYAIQPPVSQNQAV